MGDNDDTRERTDTKHTPRPQPHEQLLVGGSRWIDNDNERGDDNERRGTTTTTMRGDNKREDDDERGGTTMGDDTTTTMDTTTWPRRHSSPGYFSCFLFSGPGDTRLLDCFFFFLFSFVSLAQLLYTPHAYEHLLVGWFDNCS